MARRGGALLVISLMHLLPDAWSAARTAGIWPPAIPVAALGSFALAGVAARSGCACHAHRQHSGSAGAQAVHRFLEGSALALAASVTITVALAVHALGEGLAAGALPAGQSRRRVGGWLATMRLSPVAGAAAISAFRLQPAARPVLVALAAGVLAEAARISPDAACRAPTGRRLATPCCRRSPGGCGRHRRSRPRRGLTARWPAQLQGLPRQPFPP